MHVDEPTPFELKIPASGSRRHGAVGATATITATAPVARNVRGGDLHIDPGAVAASAPRPRARSLEHLRAVMGVPPRMAPSRSPDIVAGLGAVTRAPLGSQFPLTTIEVAGAGAVRFVTSSTSPTCGTGIAGLLCKFMNWIRSL